MEFYPKPGSVKSVQIDLDPGRIGLRYPADIGLIGDCKQVLAARCRWCGGKKTELSR